MVSLLLLSILSAAPLPDVVSELWAADADACRLAATDPEGTAAYAYRWLSSWSMTPAERTQAELALRLLLPSLSDQSVIARPVRVSPTLWRVDAREVALDSVRFLKAWDKVALADPYIPFATPHVPRPYLTRLDYWLANAARSPGYSDLLGLGKDLNELAERVRLDAKGNELLALDRQAAVLVSQVAVGKPRQVVRQNALTGQYYFTRDVLKGVGDQDPLEQIAKIRADGGEGIGTLPNGLRFYTIFDAAGKLVDKADPALVQNYSAPGLDRVIHNGLDSCLSCHGGGYIPPKDAIKIVVDGGVVNLAALKKQEALRLERLYLRNLAGKLELDNKEYVAAVEEATGAKEPGGPAAALLATTTAFREAPIDKAAALRELGLTEDGWKALLVKVQAQDGKLPGAAAAIASGLAVHRDSWDAAYKRLVYGKYDYPLGYVK